MNKVKTIYKIQAVVILALIIALIACFTLGGTAFADTEGNVLNLEDCEKQLEENDLAGYSGIITDKDCIKQNKSVFENYIENQGGKVIIPERDIENNILAYQLVDFSDNGIAVYPIYAYNKIDKSCIDYKELVNNDAALISDSEKQRIMTAATDEDYADYTFFETSFCVYVKGYTGKFTNVAAVRAKLTIDYIPSDNPNYNHYIGRYEVVVTPINKYAFKSVIMTPIVPNDIAVDTIEEGNNHQAPVETISFGLNTGISVKAGVSVGDSGFSATIGNDRNLSISFGYSLSAPAGSAKVIKSASRNDYDSFHGNPITVSRAFGIDSQRKGVTYTGLYYASHRIKRDVQSGGLGLVISNLSLYAQPGEKAYSADNEDKVMIIAAWDQPFHNKTILYLATDPDGSQYFSDHNVYTDLERKGAFPGVMTFGE